MSEIKHIGAMTLGIIGTNFSDRNEKIKEILESDNPINKQCDCCKRWVSDTHAVASAFGAFTIGICDECLNSGRDSYGLMVSYIGCAGRFPDDINEAYREEVRYQLKLHGKTEKQFIKDVDDYNKDLMEAMKDYAEENSSKSESTTGSDYFS